MLTRSNQLAPQQEYYADSLLTQPSFGKSVYDNLVMGFATPVIAMNMLNKQFAQKPEGQAVLGAYNSLQLSNETPGTGWTQYLADQGANMIGFGLNPATWGLGGAGSLAARGLATGAERVLPDAASTFMRTPLKDLVSKPIGEYIPSMIGKEGAEQPLSLGLMSDTTLKNFGFFAGAFAPQGIVDNYNQDTNNISWGGVAREMGEMGAFGIAIGSVPFAFGVLRGKVNRGLGKDPTEEITHDDLNKVLENGQITPEEHQWYIDYLQHQNVNYFRGYQEDASHGFKPDPDFGKGYWVTPNKDYAEFYGNNLEAVQGDYKLFDADNITDPKMQKLFDKIQLLKDQTKNLSGDQKIKAYKKKQIAIDNFRTTLINKGYQGVSRSLGKEMNETMLFEKPKNVINFSENEQNLKDRATQIINNNGHTANVATNEAMFEMLTPNDMENLKGVIADQLTGNVPEEYKQALSDFVIHNRLDAMRQDPRALDGVRGYVDSINKKLEEKPEMIAKADKILDDHMLKSVKENMPFSQKEIMRHMKKVGFEASHMQQLPVTIPDNMTQHLKIADQINKFKTKLKKESNKGGITYYRGVPKDKFGYKTLEEAGTTEKAMRKDDLELGKGYWFSETKELAKKYGNEIHTAKGTYKVYDLEKGKDQQINKLYSELHHRRLSGEILKFPKPEGYIKTSDLIDKLHQLLRSKGYEGIRRFGNTGMDSGYYEVMFFDKPSEKPRYQNKQTLRRIEELQDKLPKILTPKEELNDIRKTLLTEKGLPKDWQFSNAYHRLLDLSNVWANARTLLDRIHLQNEYEKQEAFRDLAHQILKISDADLPKIAKPENVVDYLKRRIEGNLSKPEPIADVTKAVDDRMKVPTDSDTILNEQKAQIENTQAEDAKEDYQKSMDKFKEFKDSDSIFKNLISCVMGGLSGKG